MAQAAVKTWIDGEVLTAADLNALNTNILNNGLAVVSPLTGTLRAGNNLISNVAGISFANFGTEPAYDIDHAVIVRNQLSLRMVDSSLRTQTLRGYIDGGTALAATTSGTTAQTLRTDTLSPAGIVDRTDWIVTYSADIVLAAGSAGRTKVAQLLISDGAATTTLSLMTSVTIEAPQVSLTAWVAPVPPDADVQNAVAVANAIGIIQVNALSAASELDPTVAWTFAFRATTAGQAGDLTLTNTRLMLMR